MCTHWLTAFRRPFSTGPLFGPISSFVSACAAGLACTAISRYSLKGEKYNIITKQKSGGSRDLPEEAHFGGTRWRVASYNSIMKLCEWQKKQLNLFFLYLSHCDLIWFHWGCKKTAVWKERKFTFLISGATSSENVILFNKIVWGNSSRGHLYCHVAATFEAASWL